MREREGGREQREEKNLLTVSRLKNVSVDLLYFPECNCQCVSEMDQRRVVGMGEVVVAYCVRY